MREIQLDSGPSSSATHRLTQASTTLDRRYVNRPSNLAIEEAANSSPIRQDVPTPVSTPSRLVNLRVHSADVLAAQQAQAVESETPSQATRTAVVHNVVELGTATPQPQPTPPTAPTSALAQPQSISSTSYDFHALIPQEDAAANLDSIAEPSFVTEVMLSPVTPPEPYPTPATVQHVETASVTVATEAELPTTSPAPIDSESLVMNIAADYAAASLVSSSSIDAIASAVSEAIAAIRTATEPSEIARQIDSLQNFAENLRNDASSPEMLELSDTIEKFLNVVSKSTKVKTARSTAKTTKPSKTASSAKTSQSAAKPIIKTSAKPARKPLLAKRSARNADTVSARSGSSGVAAPSTTRSTTTRSKATRATRAARPAARPATTNRISQSEDQALRNALRSVASIDNDDAAVPARKRTARPLRRKTSAKRLALAFSCAAICVAGVGYFVASNIPDISVRVAAMQTGIEASTPSYIPRGYALSGISSEDGKITLTFKGPDDASFTLVEEKSSWDSSTLLRAYVEPTWKTSYTSTHEQGITIYTSGSNAAWVNGGILYKITSSGNNLTKKQLRNIVTSL